MSTELRTITTNLEAVEAEIDALFKSVESRGGADTKMTASEDRKYINLTEARGTLLARQREVREAERREGVLAQTRSQFGQAAGSGFSSGDDVVYGRGDGNSYFRDLVYLALPGDPRAHEARNRLNDHAQMIDRAASELPREFRQTRGKGGAHLELRVNPNRTDGQGGYAVPPLWIINEWVDALRAGRAVTDRCNVQDLPGGTDSINIPKTATATTTAVQTADAGAVSSTDMTDTYLTGPVRTIAGQQDISLQLLEQSPGNFDEIVFRDLIADYNQRLDLQVISGSGASGQMKGLLQVSGYNSITYTDATPTVPELYLPVAQAASQVARLRFQNADTIAMRPEHWWWIVSALDLQNRPLVEPGGNNANGVNNIAVYDATGAEGVVGSIATLPVVVDANLPNNLGAGTNEAWMFAGRFKDFYVYEGALRTRALMDVLSGTLQVRLQAYNYAATIPDRYPTALSVIKGTGTIPPTGF